MPDQGYVHGIIVKEGSGDVQVIRSPGQSIVGIVGTAPQSTELKENSPVSFIGKKAALAAICPAAALGNKGSLYDAVIGVQDQTPARMILIKAKSESEIDILTAIDALVEAESVTGFIPKILIVPGFGNRNPLATPISAPLIAANAKGASFNSIPSGDTKIG